MTVNIKVSNVTVAIILHGGGEEEYHKLCEIKVIADFIRIQISL